MLEAHDYGAFPPGVLYQHGDIMELQDGDLQRLDEAGVEEVWYWYACGSYEGCGQILMRRGSRWQLHYAGHCSCYGPTEDVVFGEGAESLEALEATCTGELLRCVAPLFDMARRNEAQAEATE